MSDKKVARATAAAAAAPPAHPAGGTRRDGVGSRDREETGDAEDNGDDLGPSPLCSRAALPKLAPEQSRDVLQKGRYCCSRPRGGGGGGCSRHGGRRNSSRVTISATVTKPLEKPRS